MLIAYRVAHINYQNDMTGEVTVRNNHIVRSRLDGKDSTKKEIKDMNFCQICIYSQHDVNVKIVLLMWTSMIIL